MSALLTRWREKLANRKARRDKLADEKRELSHKVKHARHEVAQARKQVHKHTPGAKVALPVDPILQDSWGWAPGHDGIDLICQPSAPLYAMVPARVVRADAGGWWGNNPTGDVSKGDGIIVLECLANVGPFRKGLKLCYGHAEAAVVKVGQTVAAGERIGNAGFANAWHVHFMIHGRNDVKGIGDRDPRPFIDYVRSH